MRIVQISHCELGRRVAVVDEPSLLVVRGSTSVYEFAQAAIELNASLQTCIEQNITNERLNYDEVYESRSEWKLLSPIDHPEASRCFVTGTGLTHKGSAENRQSMHAADGSKEQGARSDQLEGLPTPPTDSMKMFQIGIDGGRPKAGCIGAAPEWFYKGTGTILFAHNDALVVPAHALDGGEEAEIAGIYIIGPDRSPYRIGLAQGNEFSDHVLEAQNYLYLASSKLRGCALGPELAINSKFDDVPGRAAIERGGKAIWQASQASGERWMCHSLANLEHHHFKHAEHRRPGDVHVHFFGADNFSFKDRLRLETGDVMTISFDGFGRPLRNPILIDREEEALVMVRPL